MHKYDYIRAPQQRTRSIVPAQALQVGVSIRVGKGRDNVHTEYFREFCSCFVLLQTGALYMQDVDRQRDTTYLLSRVVRDSTLNLLDNTLCLHKNVSPFCRNLKDTKTYLGSKRSLLLWGPLLSDTSTSSRLLSSSLPLDTRVCSSPLLGSSRCGRSCGREDTRTGVAYTLQVRLALACGSRRYAPAMRSYLHEK